MITQVKQVGRRPLSTPVEKLKAFAARSADKIDLGGALRRFADDKGFSLRAIRRMAVNEKFEELFSSLVLRTRALGHSRIIEYFCKKLDKTRPGSMQPYIGSPPQNLSIDRAVTMNGIEYSGRHFFGEGSATVFDVEYRYLDHDIQNVPIAIIGYGAAGILVNFALRQGFGFRNVTVFEKSQQPLGIWRQRNVFPLSRNNPRDIKYYDHILPAAPGSGHEIRDFLEGLIYDTFTIRKDTVRQVLSSEMGHTLILKDAEAETFPIVVNATGLGKPKDISDPDRMTTNTGNGGGRWQQKLEADEVRGKHLVFIGLGNSTAEMLTQVHKLQDEGVEVDYSILTHYPQASVWSPDTDAYVGGQRYRVFRDLSKPNLVDFQGDLPQNRHDYFRALHDGKILYGVSRWEHTGSREMTVFVNGSQEPFRVLRCDRLWTLIGYQHSQETMESMGCTYDPSHHCGLFDYDGEVIADPTAKQAANRLHQGYYGFGAILETPFNPNAIVIPGMIHRDWRSSFRCNHACH
jgi:hypothetical protein